MDRETGDNPLEKKIKEGEQSFASLSDLVRAVVGEKATSRQVARMIEARGAGPISHTTVAALLRGEHVSDATIYSFSVAFGLPLNTMRALAGKSPIPTGPIVTSSGDRIVLVPDIAAVAAQISPDDWAFLSPHQRDLAIELATNNLKGVLSSMRKALEAPAQTPEEELCAA